MKTSSPAYRPAIATAFLLMLPVLGMLFTDQWSWGPADFVVMGVLVFGTGFAYELAGRRAGGTAYRAAAALALAATLLLVWISLAVGIIGSDDHAANVMYVGVLAAGILGALIARFRPHGMARALFATALAQALVGVIAVALELGAPASGPLELLALNGFFVALWAGSGLLFRRAAHAAAGRGTA